MADNPYAQFVQPGSNPYAQFKPQGAAPSWSEVPGNMASNFLPDLGRVAKQAAEGAYNFAKDPLANMQQGVRNVFSLGKSAAEATNLNRIVGTGPAQSPEEEAKSAAIAKPAEDLAKGVYTNYLTSEGLRRNLSEHPASMAINAATALTPMGAGKAAAFIDPLSLVGKGAVGTRDLGGGAVGQYLGMASGAHPENIANRFRAGELGGEAQKTALANARGTVSPTEVVADARQAISNMRQARSAAYEQGIKDTAASNQMVSIDPVLQHMDELEKSLYSPEGRLKVGDQALAAAQKVKDEIAKYGGVNFNKAGDFVGVNVEHPMELDALKQRLQGIAGDNLMNPAASRIPTAAANTVRQSIVDAVPTYKDTMEGYSKSSNMLDQIERTLSVGPRAAQDTGLRKLQSAMRTDANRGSRAELVNELTQAGAPNLPYALAGQATNPFIPHGLSRLAAQEGVLGVLGGVLDPRLIAYLTASSPRMAGGLASMAGQAVGGSRKVGNALGMTGPRARIATEAAYQSANPDLDESIRQYRNALAR